MKKILLVHNYYQQRAGEFSAVTRQIALLRQYGHDLIVYTKDNRTIKEFGLADKVKFMPNTVFSKQVYNEVMQRVQRTRPDVAHVHNVYPLLSPAIYRALKDAQVPIVQTLHNFRFLGCANSYFYIDGQICERCKYGNTLHAIKHRCYRDSYPLSALYAFTIALHRRLGTFRHIDRFIALNRFTAQMMIESGLATADKISVLGNFLAEPLPEPGSYSNRKPFFIFLGRLSPEKGIDVLIEAMASVPHLGLKVLGTGTEKERLERRAQVLGLDKVEFLGWVDGDEKWRLLREATATVVPSVCYEQFPSAALESLAVGTPVVGSNLGGLPSLVQHEETGLLFEAANSSDLAQQLKHLSASPHLAYEMGRRGRERVLSHYVASVHYEKLMAIYREVAN